MSLSTNKEPVLSSYTNYNEEGPKSKKNSKKNKGRGKSNDDEEVEGG